MESPLVRYAPTADGVDIAYWAIGRGPPIVSLPGLPHSHILKEWDIPEWRRGHELAARARTVVRYDGRGTGLSTRNVRAFSLDTFLSDLGAVVDTLGPGPVALHGVVNSCPIAIAYAVRHPERVSELVLWCPVIDASVHKSNPMLEAARRIVKTDWETFSETVAHGLFGWSQSDSARRYADLIRAGNSPDNILEMVAALHSLNVWDELPQVRCRALILHRPALSILPPGSAERVAAAIPGAELALFDGTSSAPYIGNWRPIVHTIAHFLGIRLSDDTSRDGRRALRLLNMRDESLTAREREVVGLVMHGLTNREIAAQLVLAEKTVENHVGRILVKLDLRSRTQLAAYAAEHGWGRPA